ncbi:uncharacterized protein LOC134829578 [Culicoides brevitarsis]|uniref:uncharacterized protein LOC134829578 n=1 Tax=Culicoides brevitarsis TaxID=469753 RepID=UPI00307C8C74
MLRSITKNLRQSRLISPEIRKFATSYDEVSLEDQSLFPAEEGIVQNSLYTNRILVPKCTLDQYVWSNVDKFRQKTAIECGITGKFYTYAQLRDRSATLAVNLIKRFGVTKGETVAVCLPNMPEFAVAALGCIESGSVISTFNPIYTSDEISKQMINSDTKIIISTTEHYKKIAKAVEMSNMDIKIIMVKDRENASLPPNTIDFKEITDPHNMSFEILEKNRTFDPNDTVMLPYSSGTTGVAKGVELTHRNIVSNCVMLGQNLGGETLAIEASDTFQDVLPCVLPFFHIYGWTCTLISKLQLGCKLVTLPAFKPDTFVDVLRNHKTTLIHLVPPIVTFMSNSADVKPDYLMSARMIMSGAAPLGRAEVERFVETKAPQVKFSQGYGLTETSPVAMMQSIGNMNFGSIGSPSPATQAKIINIEDPKMIGLGPGQSGEVLIRGPHIMKGYYKNEEATKETIVENGWLRTGDIGYYDENFQFYITDRMKELIKVKGFQVAPAELESILKCHPQIADAAVVGVPHKTTGEAPRGFIVAKPNTKINKEEIMNFVQEKVAPYKKLESIVIVNEIPKNATGKIMRREIKAKYL